METPPRGAPPELTAALGETLMAITGVQLNVLNAQNADPNTIVVPLPVFYHEGGRPAQLRISRDAPQGGKKLDADNFHIAFVLDTRTLGTVAVDLQTASRSVSVNVKTEAASAADRFKDSFADLRGRLEQLHYRVASVAASVAPHVRAPEPASPPTPPVILSAASLVEGQPKHHLDVQA
ncbi:MAG: flagellar hook-length control protein FliK [Candidatus Eremiobacteraeota bacterium]|nr:flagellar hook-length control protein FliK [Candidatus Eremiobacteraeota bacterium]